MDILGKALLLAFAVIIVAAFVPVKSYALSAGDLNSWQTNSNTLPQPIDQASTVNDHGFIYEIGGLINGTPSTNVYYAAANSGGSLGQWQSTSSLPTAVVNAKAVESGGYIYEIGGSNNISTYYDNVYYAQINSDGTLGSWQSTTVFPIDIGSESAVVNNGYVYVLGGQNSGGAVNNVYYAQINSDGTLGSWQSATSLTSVERNATAGVYDGYIYELGGIGSSTILNAVTYAPISANGTLGSWQSANNLPDALYNASSVVSDGYIYELGGYDNSGNTGNVYYASINSNGALGSWQTSANPLPSSTMEATSVTLGGYVYEIGGYNSGSVFNSVYYSLLSFNNAKLINNDANSAQVLVETADGTNLTCANSVNESSLSKQDSGYTYPIGLVNICYTTSDSSDIVRITFVTSLSPSEVTARDYNSLTKTYVTVPGATIAQSSYNGQPALILTYSITPGGELDSSQTSGLVDDPVGLGLANSTSSNVSSSIVSPDTGYGEPAASSSLSTFLGVAAIIITGAGLTILCRHKISRTR